jgi:hypothetical protein
MRHRPWLFMVAAISVSLMACSSAPSISESDKHLTDAKDNFKHSDYKAAARNLDSAIKSAANDAERQQSTVIRVALVTAMSEGDKQMAEAYQVGVKEPAGQAHTGAMNKLRSDYYNTARTRLMDAMQEVMDQRGKLSGSAMPIEVFFPGFTGGADPVVVKIKSGQLVPDGERLSAELQTERDALARILSALAGAGPDLNKGQQMFNAGKVEVDPRVYLIEMSDSFLRIGGMFERRALDDSRLLRSVNEVVRGNLDAATKLLAAKPDKDLEARVKKMQEDCEKTLKKLGPG